MESVKKIIEPQTPDYTAVALIIIAVAVVVKIVLGLYVRATGQKVHSGSLVASGKDALLDAVISASTLVAAAIFLIWHISLEAWLAAVISLIIIKSGIDMLRESISSILGERPDKEITAKVHQTIMQFPEVSGVYDLVLHNYGPDQLIGSVHVELPDYYTVKQVDALERSIAAAVMRETNVILTGIGVYSRISGTETERAVFSDIITVTQQYPEVLQVHGFSLNEEQRNIHFDVIIDYDIKNREDIFQDIVVKIQEKYPTYKICPVLDADAADF